MLTLLSLFCSLIAIIGFFYIGRFLMQATEKYQTSVEAHANVTLAEMFLFIEPSKLIKLNIASTIASFIFVALVSGNIVVALLVATFISLAPRVVYKKLKERRIKKFIFQLPDALLTLSNSLKAGSSLNMALESLSKEQPPPLSQELGLVLREIRLGVEFDQAFLNLENRMQLQELSLVVSAMVISKEIGGNLAEVLATLSNTLRRKLEMEGKIDALTSQGKLQGIVMTGLPVFIIAALYHIEPETMSLLTEHPVGWAVLGVSSVLLMFGYKVIQKIVTIDV
ncbi:type II secretion system F family protein [Motilimonas cestriensis]|uniref:type II secretion system F family protein n=1 Tax=Motilimonas cestriensis TaxID=2742685 RepID=UPI003DA2234F